mmetsp:Transcript_19303/g.41988  ORF Transcript_19303/g.41988 Transcript_19303/m.41988 type:complete len:98 (+) Transcript_19303:160-453(+)|eukprot:CAMPEP_0168176110 /NCGR_PEP_ID=MMETSP0139_2-20121125/7573_1 /TAXON_ID=44445 /ORGANISM="Pseudo-nitzschia australis, Strain 10249 10 AB" /LENGTH=97 /DNA_ID=CAMNT_0008094727 /DNA_START=222 /DNA_END=515 /DNA_ORIENTATION=-
MKFVCALVLLASANAFAPTAQRTRTVALFAEDDGVERGVSVDQDGKSNVWAIEPKMEVESKSGEEKTKSAILAGVGLIAFAGAAGVALTNLPDPNQF